MSKIKNIKEPVVTNIKDAFTKVGKESEAPKLRWKVLVEASWFTKGTQVLQYQDDKGFWKNVPTVTSE